MSEELTEMTFLTPAIADTAAVAKPRLWGTVRHFKRTQRKENHALARSDSTHLQATDAASRAEHSSNAHKSIKQRKATLPPAGISSLWLLPLPLFALLWFTRRRWVALLKLILPRLKSDLL